MTIFRVIFGSLFLCILIIDFSFVVTMKFLCSSVCIYVYIYGFPGGTSGKESIYIYVTSVMSNSVQPHRWLPTRLRCPWDSPGKNTGVGCHFLLQFMKVKSESEVAQSYPTLSDLMDCSLPGSSVHGIFPGKSTGVGCHCFLDYFRARLTKRNSLII